MNAWLVGWMNGLVGWMNAWLVSWMNAWLADWLFAGKCSLLKIHPSTDTDHIFTQGAALSIPLERTMVESVAYVQLMAFYVLDSPEEKRFQALKFRERG